MVENYSDRGLLNIIRPLGRKSGPASTRSSGCKVLPTFLCPPSYISKMGKIMTARRLVSCRAVPRPMIEKADCKQKVNLGTHRWFCLWKPNRRLPDLRRGRDLGKDWFDCSIYIDIIGWTLKRDTVFFKKEQPCSTGCPALSKVSSPSP